VKLAGHLIVDCLKAQGVKRVFSVPGESFLAVLDGLHQSGIDNVVCRQEGGAAMMAEATGKITGRPGVAFVTRGPGATNASAGVHIAKQDSTPMILFVGQIGRRMRGREAFQEVDYRSMFADVAKWVEEIDHADRIPEIINHAWHVAMSGRPGPVVLALPEDMLRDEVDLSAGPRVEVAEVGIADAVARQCAGMIETSHRPIFILGGSRWSDAARASVADYTSRLGIPVATTFRRQYLYDNAKENYIGEIGLAPNPELRKRVERADLLVILGARFSENPSQGFELLGIPEHGAKLIHVHPGAEEVGRIYTPTLGVNATPEGFLEGLQKFTVGKHFTCNAERASFEAWTGDVPKVPGPVEMGEVVNHLRDTLPADTIFTNGAGNYAIWMQRFWRWRHADSYLGPVSGSMGYGLPAAIAARMEHRERPIVCLAGDGCFQMSMQEFGTAMQQRAKFVVIVVDNGIYGTIRMHQEREYPERVSGTAMRNPDFAALAQAYGAHGETVDAAGAFGPALDRAMEAETAAIVHVKVNPEALSPSQTIEGLRAAAR
jgi:acetolactate synthase-1/2/3 large subunit